MVKGAMPGQLATVRVDSQVWSAVSDEPLIDGVYVVIVDSQSTVLHVTPARPNQGEKGLNE